MEAATREHILCRWRGKVRIGVPDQRMSAAVVWALHCKETSQSCSVCSEGADPLTSVVSRKRSAIRPRWMCSFLLATSVKTTRSATSWPAHLAAVSLRCCSPGAGKRRSQRIEFGCF